MLRPVRKSHNRPAIVPPALCQLTEPVYNAYIAAEPQQAQGYSLTPGCFCMLLVSSFDVSTAPGGCTQSEPMQKQ